MTVNLDLSGRRVLLTGASSGIGAATCRALAAAGASVAMIARRKERLDELTAELGPNTVGIPADVTDPAALQAAVQEAASRFGGLDAVVAVAGRMMAGGMVSGDPQVWREIMDLNLVAPLATARHAYPHFGREGRRDIIIVGSAGAKLVVPSSGIYAASKRGLLAACEALRLELAAEGINVGVVMPGMFETEGLTLDGITLDGDIPPNDFPLLAPGSTPGPPEIVADTIAFMLSLPEGAGINEIVVRPTGQYTP